MNKLFPQEVSLLPEHVALVEYKWLRNDTTNKLTISDVCNGTSSDHTVPLQPNGVFIKTLLNTD